MDASAYRKQLMEPRTSLVRTFEFRHGVRIALIGADPYVFGINGRKLVNDALATHRGELSAEMRATDCIKRAQRTARYQLVRQ